MDRVYVLECNGVYKIGYTSQKTVKDRVKQMETGNPFEIKIIREFNCKENDGREREKKLHQLFNDKRIKLEWFKLNATDLMQIDKFMGVDIVELELIKRKEKLEKDIKERIKNIRDLEEIEKQYIGLQDRESNHITLENKKIKLFKGTFNGQKTMNGTTKFASKEYFVNIYFSEYGGATLSFKRKIGTSNY